MDRETDLLGNYTVRRFPHFRRVFIDSLDVLAPSRNMLGLVELDITDARRAIREARRKGRAISLQAFLIKSIAEAVHDWPELNSIPKGNRLFLFDDVDINMPLELDIEGVRFPKQVVIRRANEKSVFEICAEIDGARVRFQQEKVTGTEDKWALRVMLLLGHLPSVVRRFLLRRIISSPLAIKRNHGTIHYTSVAGISQTSGFVVPCLTNRCALDISCGNIERKPAAHHGSIELREIMSMTLMFNHAIIDGAQAARFSRRLRQAIEGCELPAEPKDAPSTSQHPRL